MDTHKTTTEETLLGLLSLGPMSGYQMRNLMQDSTANFWRESYGRIYPALKRMKKAGLVELDKQASAGPRAKKVYRLTTTGQKRLRAWLGVPAQPLPNRNELLLKLFFGDRATPGTMAAQVLAWQQSYAADLKRYELQLAELEATHAKHPGLPFWRMTLRYGISEAIMVINWCADTMEELKSPPTRDKG
jgi:DNA-binding PadR family transcriptional regulator